MGVFVSTQWPLTTKYSVHPPSEHVAEFGEIPSRCSWDSRGWDAMMSLDQHSLHNQTWIITTRLPGCPSNLVITTELILVTVLFSTFSSSSLMLCPQPGLHLMHCIFPSPYLQFLQRTPPCCHSIWPASPRRSLPLSFLVVDKHFWTVSVCLWSLHLDLSKSDSQFWQQHDIFLIHINTVDSLWHRNSNF